MRTLAEFLADFDQQKQEQVEDPDISNIAGAEASGILMVPLVDQWAERAGVERAEISEAALRRTEGGTEACVKMVARDTALEVAARLTQSSAWMDGFLAGVLWQQARDFEQAMGE